MEDSVARLTVLTTRGIPAVKTFTRRERDGALHTEGYGRAKSFTAREIETDERGRWLRRLAKEGESFVVLGAMKGWREGEVRRRLSTDREGDEASLEDVPRIWMPVDVDHLDFEPMAGFQDGETLALEVLARLKIQGTQCIWHLTNSHMVTGKHRVRLWVRLAKAATAEQMREWAKLRWGEEKVDVDGKPKRIVDLSVLRPAQPIYTGDPVFVGMDDPVERRVGSIEGEPLEMKASRRSRERGKAPEDENIAALQAAGLYLRKLRPGQHAITCPWDDGHTGEERVDDTFYFEPHHNGHDIPSFKCHHDGCSDRHWADVVEKLGIRGNAFTPVGGDEEGEERFVYVHRLKQFWDPRDGALIDRESYDSANGGKTKRGTPTERFIASPRTLKTDAVEFLPGEGRILRRRGIKVLNTYVDMRLDPDPSVDVTPWTEHLEWLIPRKEERERLCDWMAWAYQKPGDKIAWAPILYGPPGTGKTTVFNALAYCIGPAYMSEPTQAELEDKFNDWCWGKLLVKIEELMSGDKFHVAEKLKPIVANPSISVRMMHRTGFVVTNVANVCASTNHMQALPIEKGDRRYMLVECTDAPVAERSEHMQALHRWLSRETYAGIASWLSERDVNGFHPRDEAPDTRLKRVVVEASRTDLERAVDLCEAFDREEVVTSAVLQEYLANNDCLVKTQRFGLIAARRRWLALPDQQRRVRTAGRKLTLWSPSRSNAAMMRVTNMEPGARDRWLSNLAAKQLFASDKGRSDADGSGDDVL